MSGEVYLVLHHFPVPDAKIMQLIIIHPTINYNHNLWAKIDLGTFKKINFKILLIN